MKDLHMHSAFSDGKNTPEEMIEAAIALGLDTVGLSDHSHAESDECGMSPEGSAAYRAEMDRLKPLYAGKIRVLCGLERDYYSDDFAGYDYIIGSVHAIRMPDGYYLSVDNTPEILSAGVEKYYAGDWYAMTEDFFALEKDVVRQTKCDIIGHFDLVTKFNEQHHFFDTSHPRYVAAWKNAADELLKTGKPFEVNTGAISRGYRTVPYPSAEMREYIKAHGGTLVLSSDSHSKENIAFQFDRWAAVL